jgi:competence protein ComEC
MKDKIFYAICFGFALGVLLRSFIFINIFTALLLCVISVGLVFFHGLVSKNRWGILAGIFILVFSLGIIRFHLADKARPSAFEKEVGESLELSGKIITEPDIRETNQKLTVETNIGKEKTDILLTIDLTDNYRYGDAVDFYGKLEKPENFTTDYGKEFDYVDYLKKDGILYVMNFPKVAIVSHDNGNAIKGALFNLKDKFVDKINLAIRAPENIFMGGLILGEKSSFSQALRQNFIKTSTIHIVALSGYNVTIVAEWIMKIFAFLPKNLGIGAGILAIILFILMTGGSSTAIRAGIMATLALVARATGRNYDVTRALLVALVVMILLNPYVLAYDVSFELSFIATMAVIFLAPRIEKYFLWVTDKFELRDILSVTCAAYIFVMPFILYKMGTFSLVALPTNMLILPFIPFTMLLGFITGGLGLIWYVFAVPAGFISYIFLHYELLVINIFASFPFSSLAIPNFPLLITLAIYAYFIYRLFGRNIKKFFQEI